MARTLLDNEQWDFGTNCFVCEPKNERGLGIPFYLDDEAGQVVAEFTPETHQSGAPSFAHGGLSMALLDEGMSWAVIAIAHRFGLTRSAETAFQRPVRVGRPHFVVCWLEPGEGHDRVTLGEVRDAEGRVCVSMKAAYYVMTKEEATAALGAQSKQADAYTR